MRSWDDCSPAVDRRDTEAAAEGFFFFFFLKKKKQVYDTASHSKVDDIAVDGLQYAGDIAACEETSQLYVLDIHPSNQIWKVDPSSGQASVLVKFGPKDQALSMAVRSGRVVLTGKFIPKLSVYDGSDGSSIKTINVSDINHCCFD